MNKHYTQATNQSTNRDDSEIFRFPTRAEMHQKKEQEQAKLQQKTKSAETDDYKSEDLSGCLSGCLSGALNANKKAVEPPKPAVTSYKDEDLSGCLSGFLKPQSPAVKSDNKERFMPTQRNLKTGEITPIERDDRSGSLAPLDEDKSGWLYFN